ncbi:hypothetical protein HWV62_445 [Athelia sp. TMB]|nr:hypothetical protein HWV62_445 [Athelia sp. TMB]
MAPSGSEDKLFPAIGTYVVFSIDAEMTLAAMHDEHVAEVTKKMENKAFVGYIAAPDRIINHDSEFQSFRVEILREGFPPRVEDLGIESDMCVPVWPTINHPLSRAPLRTVNDKPLPWTNCYHSSFTSIIVRVPTAYASDEGAFRLSPGEIARHSTIRDEDQTRAYDLCMARNPISSAAEASEDPSQPKPQDGGSSRYNSQHSLPEESLADDEHDSAKSAEEFAQAIVNMAERDRPSETMITVEMTYDLSFAETLTDPQELYLEKEILEKLEQDTKAGAIERARRIDEEAFGGGRKQQGTSSAAAERTAIDYCRYVQVLLENTIICLSAPL